MSNKNPHTDHTQRAQWRAAQRTPLMERVRKIVSGEQLSSAKPPSREDRRRAEIASRRTV